MGWRLRLAAAIAAVSLPLAAIAAIPKPAVVQEEISRVGADAVVSGLLRGGQWDLVQSRISAGDDAWVQIAGTLLHTQIGCAGCAESLPISLAMALEQNPVAVLEVLGSPRDIDRVCGAPFIEPPARFMTAHIDNAMKSLHAINDPALAERRDACLARLRQISVWPVPHSKG